MSLGIQNILLIQKSFMLIGPLGFCCQAAA